MKLEDDELWDELRLIHDSASVTPEMYKRAEQIRDRLMELGHGTNDHRGWARWMYAIFKKCETCQGN